MLQLSRSWLQCSEHKLCLKAHRLALACTVTAPLVSTFCLAKSAVGQRHSQILGPEEIVVMNESALLHNTGHRASMSHILLRVSSCG